MAQPKRNKESITQALHTLNEAAKEQKEDIKGMIREDYKYLSNIVSSIPPTVRSVADDAKDRIDQKNDELSKEVNKLKKSFEKTTAENPWRTLGIASATAFVVGFLMRNKNNS